MEGPAFFVEDDACAGLGLRWSLACAGTLLATGLGLRLRLPDLSLPGLRDCLSHRLHGDQLNALDPPA